MARWAGRVVAMLEALELVAVPSSTIAVDATRKESLAPRTGHKLWRPQFGIQANRRPFYMLFT